MSPLVRRFDGDRARYVPPVYKPLPEAVAHMEGLTKRQVQDFSTRLGRLSCFQWSVLWAGVGTLFLGGVIGGAFGLIGFLAQSPSPSSDARLVYFGALVVAFIVAVLCFAASATAEKERAESASAIKEDMDRMLDDYPTLH